MGLPLCQALGQVLGTHLSSASQSLQSLQRDRYGHFRPDSSSLRVCAAHCRPFSIPGPDPLNSQAGRQLKMPPHISICLQRAPLPRLRTTAGETDLERTEKFGCTSWVWCTLVFARMVAFLLFLHPRLHVLPPTSLLPSPPKGKPDGPEWLSLSQRQRETLARRHNEGLSDPEHCGGAGGRTPDKTYWQPEGTGKGILSPSSRYRVHAGWAHSKVLPLTRLYPPTFPPYC